MFDRVLHVRLAFFRRQWNECQRYSTLFTMHRNRQNTRFSGKIKIMESGAHQSLFFRLHTLWMKLWYFPFLRWSPGVELLRKSISSCSICLGSCLANCHPTVRKLDSPLYTNTMLSVSKDHQTIKDCLSLVSFVTTLRWVLSLKWRCKSINPLINIEIFFRAVSNFNTDYRFFNVRMWSFCTRVHTGDLGL